MNELFWIIVLTSIWVFIDAKVIGIKKGQIQGMGNMTPSGWFFACLLMWFISFPFYIMKRPEFKRVNAELKEKNNPTTAKTTTPRENGHSIIHWIGIIFFSGLFYLVFWGQDFEQDNENVADDFPNLVRINPVPQAKQLAQQEKFAEAEDYLSYFMDYDYVNQDPQAVQIYNEIQETRNDWLYKLKKANLGFWSGESDEIEGQYAAVVSDFLVIGDIRDLGQEVNNLIQEKDVDEVSVALSVVSVMATGASLVTNGIAATAKPAISFLKFTNKIGKMPKWLGKSLIESAEIAKKTENLDHLADLFSDIQGLYKTAGVRSTLELLGKSKNQDDFRHLAEFGSVFGKKTSPLLKVAGDDVITAFQRLENVNKDILLEASTFGQDGIKALEKSGPIKFNKFIYKKRFFEKSDQSHRTELRKNMGNTCYTGQQAHHIIPINVVKEFSKKICGDVFDPQSSLYVNGDKNGICLPSTEDIYSAHHSGQHPAYDNQIKAILDEKSGKDCELLSKVMNCARNSLATSSSAGLNVNQVSLSCDI